jgi:hypothetical protein
MEHMGIDLSLKIRDEGFEVHTSGNREDYCLPGCDAV